jgi:hypothetical protein
MFSFLFIVVWCLCVGSRVFISAFLQLVSLCHVWRYPTGENSFHFIWHHIVSDVCFIYNIQQSRCMDTCIQVSFLEKWFMWSFLYFYYIFFHLRIASEVSFSSLVCIYSILRLEGGGENVAVIWSYWTAIFYEISSFRKMTKKWRKKKTFFAFDYSLHFFHPKIVICILQMMGLRDWLHYG